jgi:Streptomyces sporulation and cell division protein, SsgA
MDFAPTVTRSIRLEMIDATGTATPVQAELRYDRRDPYAVSAMFRTGTSEARWVFSRDLIADGIYEPSGEGDVHVWPCLDAQGRAVVIIELCSPDGEALLQARSEALTAFIASTDEVVPRGSESLLVDMDAMIETLLPDAG